MTDDSLLNADTNGFGPNHLYLFLAVDCGPLSAPKNGSSSGNITVFPNSLVFKCDPGFILNGSATRACQANGTWSGMQATCNGRFSENCNVVFVTILTGGACHWHSFRNVTNVLSVHDVENPQRQLPRFFCFVVFKIPLGIGRLR